MGGPVACKLDSVVVDIVTDEWLFKKVVPNIRRRFPMTHGSAKSWARLCCMACTIRLCFRCSLRGRQNDRCFTLYEEEVDNWEKKVRKLENDANKDEADNLDLCNDYDDEEQQSKKIMTNSI